MGKAEKLNFLAIIAVSLFLLYVNRNMVETLFASLSTGEELLWWAGFGSIMYFVGNVSALKEMEQESGERTRLATSLDEIAGVNLSKIFAYGEQLENYPASLSCLRKIKSYQVLAYFGGALTITSVGIVFIYLMAETRFNSSFTFFVGVLLIFSAESAIVKIVVSYHNTITKFVGSEGLDIKLISKSLWDTFKRSLSNLLVGVLFFALALSAITTLDNFSNFANHPEVLRGIHYLIVFASLTSAVGWIGTGIYQMLPHISPQYADYELPNANEAFFTDIEQRPDGTFLFQTAEDSDEEQGAGKESST